jgi:hypothetical protein
MIQKGERLDAQRELLADLGLKLRPWGFNPKPSGQDFYQNRPNGKWAFHVSFIPHKDDFDLTAHVAVRINELEDLVNKYDSKRNPAEKRKSMTLGAELGNLSRGQPVRWTVADRGDIPDVCDKVVEAFERIGLPFLHTYSDLASVYHALLSSEPKNMHLAPILGPRYMRVVIAANVLGHIDEVKTLSAKYEAELSATEDLYLEDFRCLSRSLSKGDLTR